MRPRVFPAEDLAEHHGGRPRRPRFNEAAGIPRGRRASHLMSASHSYSFNEAAGIPRGRHGSGCRTRRIRPPCFNEAAGIPRGRRRRLRRPSSASGASFNEAAGIPRGRRDRGSPSRSSASCFNEAAGIPRGRLTYGVWMNGFGSPASMRPRVFPAEDVESGSSTN